MGDSDQQAAYAITDKERFLFDLNGFVVRPGILEADEIAAIRDQIYRLRYDRDSLPATERAILGGSSSVLINHPAVLGIVKSVINSEVRIEHSYSVWRERGESHEAPFHRGGPKSIQADPIFGYRCDNGRIYAGMVRVVIELTDIDETNGGGTWFIPGSHRGKIAEHYNVSHRSEMNSALETKVDPSQSISVSLEPGDVTFHHCRMLHHTGGNYTDTPRRGLITHFWAGD